MSSSANSTTTTTMSSSDTTSSSSDATTSTDSSTAATSSIDTSAITSSVASVLSSEILSSSTPPSSSPTPTSATPTSEVPVTTTSIAPTTRPATTIVETSVVEISPSGTNSASRVTVVVTATSPATTDSGTVATITQASSTTSSGATYNTPNGTTNDGKSSGLSSGGVTAIAVVVPVVVVALLVLAGIFFWRKRKQKKAAEDARRKEVEDYGFNPNNDPTLPVVASESGHEMLEDNGNGYRGWGAATASSRKMSTTLSGGHTQGQLSDAGTSAYYAGAHSPTRVSDGHSGEALMNGDRRETMNSDEIGALGQAPIAGAGIVPGMKRGPSNASSTYSAGAAPSETSDGTHNGLSQSYEAYNPNTGFGYSQHGPYGDGTYGGAGDAGMPVVRDVSARRNTRIQQPGNYQQGNSGISQNF